MMSTCSSRSRTTDNSPTDLSRRRVLGKLCRYVITAKRSISFAQTTLNPSSINALQKPPIPAKRLATLWAVPLCRAFVALVARLALAPEGERLDTRLSLLPKFGFGLPQLRFERLENLPYMILREGVSPSICEVSDKTKPMNRLSNTSLR